MLRLGFVSRVGAQADNMYCGPGNVPSFGASDGVASLPQACFYTALSGTPSPGAVTVVPSGGNFQTALNNANCGDVIELTAGASYAGTFTLPAKGCDDNHWITIRTTTPNSQLPTEGTRTSPCWSGVASLAGRPSYACPAGGAANLTAQLTTSGTNNQLIVASTGSTHFRFIGIEFAKTPTVQGTQLVSLQNADHIIIDRCWLHGNATDELQGGVALAGTYLSVIDSYLSDFKCLNTGSCIDSQAVAGGIGDYAQKAIKVVNNYMESAAETFMWGGAGATIIPSDLEIRRNFAYKPYSIWRMDQPGYIFPSGTHPVIKNLGEFKNVSRALIEGNDFEETWQGQSDQPGAAILFTPKNQNGKAPIAIDEDVVFRFNKIAHAASSMEAANVCAKNFTTNQCTNWSSGIHRINVHDNLFDDINFTNYSVLGSSGQTTSGAGWGFMISNSSNSPTNSWPDHLTFNHNTMLLVGGSVGGSGGGGMISQGGSPVALINTISWTNSFAPSPAIGTNGYAAISGGWANQINTINTNWTFSENVMPTAVWTGESLNGPYPSTNQTCGSASATCFPMNWSAVQFVNYNNGNGGNYQLASGSPYKSAGTDGQDIGANITCLNSVLAGAAPSTCSSGGGGSTPPSVAITSPANNATVSGTLAIAGTAAPGSATLSSVQIAIDGGAYTNATGTTNWTFSLNTTTLSNGSHTITAKAVDTSGNFSTASITVTVSNGAGSGPTIAITFPANNATVSGTITVTGTAGDPSGIANVQTSIDGGTFFLASGTSSWTLGLNTTGMTNGGHSLVAMATNVKGSTATASIAFTVSNSTGSLPPFIATPINDLGTGTYLGFEGGLYENGTNSVPSDHNTDGLSKVGGVQPLDVNGNPSSSGHVVLVSISMSNGNDEFCGSETTSLSTTTCPSGTFMEDAKLSTAVNHTSLVLANGAMANQVAQTWTCATGTSCTLGLQNNYDRVKQFVLAPSGLSEKQVEAVWIKEADPGPRTSLPNSGADAYTLESNLGQILRAAKTRWPNLKLAFFSSRIYAGYATTTLNPEPYAYESGFAVKWLIQAQINQIRNGTIDPTAGDLSYSTSPWIAWGPYLWADGTIARSDGLIWCDGQSGSPCNGEQDYSDGTHPSPAGVTKVGNMMMNYFLSSPYSAPWFTANGSSGGANPAITSALTATGNTGAALSYQITATNSPTSFNATDLPAGLAMNTATGLISGTPVSTGTFNVTLSAANSAGTGSATLVLTIFSACDVNEDGVVNVADVQLQVNQAIGVAPCTSDFDHDGSCNVIEVQRVVNAALGLQCVVGP